MSKKYKRICMTLNYIKRFLLLASTVTRFISISTFASSVGISIGFTVSAVGLKTCAITAVIEKYNLIIKKIKKYVKIVLIAKTELKSIQVLIYKVLIDSNISHDEYVLINNVLKEYNYMKEEINYVKVP